MQQRERLCKGRAAVKCGEAATSLEFKQSMVVVAVQDAEGFDFI
jgi:hypothetical protein